VTRVAVYDCGTNTTRVLIADVVHGKVKEIERHCTITGLGRGVHGNGVLSAENIDRVYGVLQEYSKIVSQHKVDAVRLIATSASRDATNAADFAKKVSEITGCDFEIISGEQEGRLTFRGATNDVEWSESTVLLDIGGGSTEIASGFPAGDPEIVTSLQMGAVRTTEQFLKGDPPKAEELSQAVSIVRDEFEQIKRDYPSLKKVEKFVGVAGTITTAAAVEIGLEPYDPTVVHHFILKKSAAEDVFRTLATEPLTTRIKNPGLEPDRGDVIVGGLVILVAFMRALDLDECVVSEADLLDGVALATAEAV
jgi:exopolyphosphatase/guanosine-5'-triphosphate,3'-diphosphate pyrophosphatase